MTGVNAGAEATALCGDHPPVQSGGISLPIDVEANGVKIALPVNIQGERNRAYSSLLTKDNVAAITSRCREVGCQFGYTFAESAAT